MGETPQNFLQKIFGLGGHSDSPQPATPNPDGNAAPDLPPVQPAAPKKNIFKRLFSGDKKPQPTPDPNEPPQ